MQLDKLYTSVIGMERDFELSLDCTEEQDNSGSEYPMPFSEPVSYIHIDGGHAQAFAHGFFWNHPNGALISGRFDKPVMICSADIKSDGDLYDVDYDYKALAKALCEKLGNIAEIDNFRTEAGF